MSKTDKVIIIHHSVDFSQEPSKKFFPFHHFRAPCLRWSTPALLVTAVRRRRRRLRCLFCLITQWHHAKFPRMMSITSHLSITSHVFWGSNILSPDLYSGVNCSRFKCDIIQKRIQSVTCETFKQVSGGRLERERQEQEGLLQGPQS